MNGGMEVAVIKPFDLTHLYSSAEEYKKDLAALEYVSNEIGRLHDEIKTAMNDNAPNAALEEKMQTYIALIKQREYLYHAVAQAEKNLEQGIDMLSQLEHVSMPDGKHIRVVKRDDFLHAQVYVLDESDRVQDTIVLEMASKPEDVAKVQGIINDLHAYLTERLKENVHDVDEPIYDVQQIAEIEQNARQLEKANEKMEMFADFKKMMADLGEKLAPYIGRAKEMIQQLSEYVKSKFQVLKVSINEWGQYNLGGYRSVRKAFDSLNQLEQDYKEYAQMLDDARKKREEVSDKMADIDKKMDRLQHGKGFKNLFTIHKDKKLEQLHTEYRHLSHQHDMLSLHIEKMEKNLDIIRHRRMSAFGVDTMDLSDKTVGPYTIQVQKDKDGIGVVLSYRGKPYEHIYLPIDDKRPMAVRLAELERFNKAVKSMSPKSIDERSPEQSVDPELEKYVQDKKNGYTDRIRNIMTELENAPDAAFAKEKMKELIEIAQEYSNYSNHACDMYIDAEGNFNLDFVDQNQNKLHETFLIKMDPEVSKEVMNVAHSMGGVNDMTYAIDQSQEFELASSLYIKQYKQLSQKYIEANDMEGLRRLNDTLVNRMTSFGQMLVGDAVVTVSRFGDGFKLHVQTPNGRPEVVVCPVGLDGKIEIEQLEKLVHRTVKKARETKVYDRIRDLPGGTTSDRTQDREADIPQQGIENTRNASANIYDTISRMDVRDNSAKEREKDAVEREAERV